MKKQIMNLPIHIFSDRQEMGKAAAFDAANRIRNIIREKGEANLVFAAAPSQNELLEYLQQADIDWTKVRAFHQDEYVGISASEPAGFGNFLDNAIFNHLPFRSKHYLLCSSDQVREKCMEYEQAMEAHPIDLIFLGIGENGHLAFNDPAVADFEDPLTIKVVELDQICRQQQVNDGCFSSLEEVPTQAMTLTMSCIMKIPQAICVVPGNRKANAVYHAVCGPVTTDCPASILRHHPSAALYLDADSASLLP